MMNEKETTTRGRTRMGGNEESRRTGIIKPATTEARSKTTRTTTTLSKASTTGNWRRS